jgi:hypothetical protein
MNKLPDGSGLFVAEIETSPMLIQTPPTAHGVSQSTMHLSAAMGARPPMPPRRALSTEGPPFVVKGAGK